MSIEENKDLVCREIEEGWHKGNLLVVDEIYAANFIDHSPFPGTTPDREGIKQFIKIIRDAFPDIKLTIEDLIAESDKVVERVTATGTNKGEFMGITPTGKQIIIPVITINRFAGDKIVERWSISDQLAMMQQLGTIPSR
jgi:predicted ester cyclase